MNKLDGDLLYLCGCALQNRIPDSRRIAEMDLTALYAACSFRSLTALAASALESAGTVLPSEWTEKKAKAIRKTLLLDAERAKLYAFFEEKGIWYMSLKGIVLKEYYPSVGLREMSDNDILYDPAYRETVMEYMLQNGYTAVSVGKGVHDTYHKLPIYNFELHRALYNEYDDETLSQYYRNVRQSLVQVHENGMEYRFNDEDFYLYILSHAYRHYMSEGIGIRALVDCYVYLHAKGDCLDWAYMEGEAEKIGMSVFFRIFFDLGRKLFDEPMGENWTKEERQMLDDCLEAGTHGTFEGGITKNVQRKGGKAAKLKYLWGRLFPRMAVYQVGYPFFYKHKWLLPAAWLWRLMKGLTKRGKRIFKEISIVRKA